MVCRRRTEVSVVNNPMKSAMPGFSQLWFAAPLARRLILVMSLALFLASGLLLYGSYVVSRQALQTEHEASARRLARLFEASLRTAMLRRDLTGLSEILQQLGSIPGVRSASLLHVGGEIRFASREGDKGRVEPGWVAGLCLTPSCAASPPKLEYLDAGSGLLRIAYPIRNQPRCGICHGPIEARPVNGVLVMELQPSQALDEPAMASHMVWLLPVGLSALGVMAVMIWWLVRREVLKPVTQLAAVARRVTEGDMSARSGSLHGGELGQLGEQLDAMTSRLGDMLERSRQQQAFLQALVDAAPDPMAVIGEDYRITLANKAYAQLLDQAPGSLLGRTCHAASRGLNEPCATTLVHCPLAELRAKPEPLRTVMTLQKADGSPVSVEIHAAPLIAPDGQRLMVEVIRSLDAQVRFSQEQRLSAVGLLANGVAHEIHNPLASIRLALQASLRGLRQGSMEAEEITEYLELVDAEIDRCVLTTKRLMNLSQPPGDPIPVNLKAAMDDVLALLAEEARSSRAVVIQAYAVAEPMVLGDQAELRQIGLNLIQNAFHAMPDGGELRIGLDCQGEDYCFSVQDQGVGIPHEEQPLIFMPFFSRRADGQRGSGLGLAICKAIIDRYGGRITVESEPGQGSTFRVFLKRADGDMA